jgi:hypothetical protein
MVYNTERHLLKIPGSALGNPSKTALALHKEQSPHTMQSKPHIRIGKDCWPYTLIILIILYQNNI